MGTELPPRGNKACIVKLSLGLQFSFVLVLSHCPKLDADIMGAAPPRVHHMTMFINGFNVTRIGILADYTRVETVRFTGHDQSWSTLPSRRRGGRRGKWNGVQA